MALAPTCAAAAIPRARTVARLQPCCGKLQKNWMPDPEDITLSADTGPEIQTVELQTAPVADEVLLAAVDLARTALEEITSADSIGSLLGHMVEGERVVSLFFDCTLPGYPGWRWTVSLARSDENAVPTVLETELTPGEYALTAPDWVPWSDRLIDDEGDMDDDEPDDEADAEADDDEDGPDGDGRAGDGRAGDGSDDDEPD